MKELRLKRYRDKINYIIDNIKDLPLKSDNKFIKRGVFYSIQTSIESLIDLVAMLVKDLGIQVKDDETNISELIINKNLNPELGNKLKKANGLRNILVHRYNSVEDQIILDSAKKLRLSCING
ncbi:MAG: DUF86 domain-containing protein [Promethearchaeota archaeon]